MNEIYGDYEYEYIRDQLQRIAELFVDYPPIKDLPLHTSLQEYLTKVAELIGGMLPFDHQGIGIGPVIDQLIPFTALRDLPEPGYRFTGYRHDCKVPAALTAAVVRAVAERHHWPLQPELVMMSGNAHAYIAVRVKPATESSGQELPFTYPEGKYYMVDFESIGGKSISGVALHSEEKYEQLIEYKRIVRETDIAKGLSMYDQQYAKALAQNSTDNP